MRRIVAWPGPGRPLRRIAPMSLFVRPAAGPAFLFATAGACLAQKEPRLRGIAGQSVWSIFSF
jgi:hypothetical protein